MPTDFSNFWFGYSAPYQPLGPFSLGEFSCPQELSHAESEAIELALEADRHHDEQLATPIERQQAFEDFMGWVRP